LVEQPEFGAIVLEALADGGEQSGNRGIRVRRLSENPGCRQRGDPPGLGPSAFLYIHAEDDVSVTALGADEPGRASQERPSEDPVAPAQATLD
jgi:hypothetical protein